MSSPAPKSTYLRFGKPSSNGWTAAEDDDEEEEEEGEDDDQDEGQQYLYDDDLDEDEFGLPSISSMRRGAKRIPKGKIHDPGGVRDTIDNDLSLLNAGLAPGRDRANSSDIAEERGPPEYPTAGKSEGKILRPQYKEILRGLSSSVCPHIYRADY